MILCCGEALIDMLPAETTSGEHAFVPRAGGAVFNTAIALGRLQIPAGLLSGLSNDLFGKILQNKLCASHVDTSHVVVSDRPTTLAFVRLVDGHARYAFYDENTAGRLLSASALPPLAESVKALFFGGISLISEPCGSTYEALMSKQASGLVTMLDPNIRPGFVADEAAYRARLDRMIAVADIVKVSDEDLAWLEGSGEVDELAPRILARGPRVAIVTRGDKGVRAYCERFEVQGEAQSADVVDTVGAGDTFNAGVLATLHERGLLAKEAVAEMVEADLAAAIEYGVRASAVTVSRAGADPPWRAELAVR